MARIMIADDSELVREVMYDILELGRHQCVAETRDGEETVRQYEKTRPDVLLLDLAMPKKDGYAVTKEILSLYPDAKIIIITASASQKIINSCIEAGAKACITKPFDYEDIKAVDAVIES